MNTNIKGYNKQSTKGVVINKYIKEICKETNVNNNQTYRNEENTHE